MVTTVRNVVTIGRTKGEGIPLPSIEIGIVFLNQKREVLYYTKTEPIEPDYGVIYETYNLRYLEDCMLSSVSDITQIILYPIKKHGKFGVDLEW